MDTIFSLPQAQEKCIEQNRPLFVVFTDFSRAFDTVSHDGLWKALLKYGCTEMYLNIIKLLHTGMQANIKQEHERATNFSSSTGVKQGYGLAPTLSSLYLTAMLEVASQDIND